MSAPRRTLTVPARFGAVTAFTFDPVRRVYLDNDGKVIAAAVILALRNAIADGAGSEFVRATTAYLKGDITLASWADAFAATIVGSAAAGYLLGRGGTNALTPITDDPRLHALTDNHLKAARGFGVALAASNVALGADSPALDENGDIMVDDAGNPVDENGDPILDANGDPVSADAAGSLLGGALGLLARAASYDSAALAGYSSGQSSAWGIDLPETPPAHSRCRCEISYSTDADGQVIANWSTAGDEKTCSVCIALEAEYADYPTGVYGDGRALDGGDGG